MLVKGRVMALIIAYGESLRLPCPISYHATL